MNKIYLAYSSRDRSEAERVARTLEKNGFPCFMASRDLMPGQSWADTVITTIENAPMMIVIAGDNTFDSNQIIREISYASQLNKPILIAALIPHVDLHGAAYYYLAYSKSFDLTSSEGEQKMLSYVKELFDGFSSQERGASGQSKPDKPYDGKDPYIFISYSHKDMDKVFGIIKRLQEEGFRVWYDEGIDPATEWDENIAQHIVDCGYLIAFISKNYISSNNCKDEINFARDLDKDRLLVYIEETSLPLGMSMRLRRLQAIHEYKYKEKNDFYAKLLSTAGLEKCKRE